ncbi:serine palmitoyltransferase complex subunit [Schizosaccharomyces osmophilus]|uniref:serine C-palmitoyltransferase n=1 Tax=Schizosaccharomyces osmophilus TaxID=2545709 RepID=A0AAF0ARM6_9SCHI|nr:serine palmitoyltransferase complex subunit [Schizosaccharomyces osmophilus]WBW70546.1 serine palmitoyltransferase complex subunit [Schizosaccharomyces osmophilus]
MSYSTYPFVDDVYAYYNQTVTFLGKLLDILPGSNVLKIYVKSSYQNDPLRTFIEFLLLVFAAYYVLRKPKTSPDNNYVELTGKEVNELVADWKPEPLVSPLDEMEKLELNSLTVLESTHISTKLTDGRSIINFSSFNFLGLAENKYINDATVRTIRECGLGACGPPNFYGSQDKHMRLEKDIASFIGVEATIVYAQSFQTISSVIPAFSKRGDILIVDEACNFAIQKGIQISRSTIRYFKHNDMKDLERILQELENDFQRHNRPLTRRFIITEGISENLGDMVDLSKVVALKKKYKYRLILDESWSFGTCGRTGKGLTEHFSVSPNDVEMIIGSLNTSLAGGGGFCAGSTLMVEHQRLSGMAFIFSAALPAALATASYEAIAILNRDGGSMLNDLRSKCALFHAALTRNEFFDTTSDLESPVIYLHLTKKSIPYNKQVAILQDIVEYCKDQGFLISRAKRVEKMERLKLQPSLRICISTGHTNEQIERLSSLLKENADSMLKKHIESRA